MTTCPHGGMTVGMGMAMRACGDRGWLCHACREDRQDARTDRLVEGLAMAGLLAHGACAECSDDNLYGDMSVTDLAVMHAAALRPERSETPPAKKPGNPNAPSPYDLAGMAKSRKERR